jgi:hypothetical protein
MHQTNSKAHRKTSFFLGICKTGMLLSKSRILIVIKTQELSGKSVDGIEVMTSKKCNSLPTDFFKDTN